MPVHKQTILSEVVFHWVLPIKFVMQGMPSLRKARWRVPSKPTRKLQLGKQMDWLVRYGLSGGLCHINSTCKCNRRVWHDLTWLIYLQYVVVSCNHSWQVFGVSSLWRGCYQTKVKPWPSLLLNSGVIMNPHHTKRSAETCCGFWMMICCVSFVVIIGTNQIPPPAHAARFCSTSLRPKCRPG